MYLHVQELYGEQTDGQTDNTEIRIKSGLTSHLIKDSL